MLKSIKATGKKFMVHSTIEGEVINKEAELVIHTFEIFGDKREVEFLEIIDEVNEETTRYSPNFVTFTKIED